MRLALVISLYLTLLSTDARAQHRDPPYEAVIVSEEVIVRSGPGRDYYSTGKLKPGDRVTVQRHDPGGWWVISPPPGSFDWVLADNVEIIAQPQGNTPGRGAIKNNGTVVRIGSLLEPDKLDVYHLELSRGTRITILGQKVFNTPNGPRQWYKIAPPQRDTRWILSQFVKPIGLNGEGIDPFEDGATGGDLPSPNRGQQRQRKRARHLFAEQNPQRGYDENESDVGEPQQEDGGLVERKVVRTRQPQEKRSESPGMVRTGPSRDELEDDRQRISALDARFRKILRHEDASQWDFTALEQDYKNLQHSAAHDAIRRQVNLRLRTVAKYRKIKAEHEEFVRLTKESDEREASILSLRGKSRTPAPTDPQTRTSRRRFSGAGIIQRSVGAPPGAPAHALVALDGRVLAYLHPVRGLNLDQYLGRGMGLNGRRTHRPEWRTDLIVVEKVTPVRLVP